jgi:hypothetical protein
MHLGAGGASASGCRSNIRTTTADGSTGERNHRSGASQRNHRSSTGRGGYRGASRGGSTRRQVRGKSGGVAVHDRRVPRPRAR